MHAHTGIHIQPHTFAGYFATSTHAVQLGITRHTFVDIYRVTTTHECFLSFHSFCILVS